MQKSARVKERLIFRRNRLGMTQEDLADKSGVSLRSISNYEGGDLPTLESLFKLAEALGVEPAYFLGEEIRELPDALNDRDDKERSAGIYSHLDTETLEKSLAQLSAKLGKISPHERKHVLGNLRAILDELEERDIMGEKPGPDEVASGMARKGIAAGDKREVSSGKSASDRIAEAVEEAAKPRRRDGAK